MDADLSLDVTAPSLGGVRREKIQEEGSDMDLIEKMFIGFLTARVKGWNLGITQSENEWLASSIWKYDTESTALYSLQTLTMDVGETVVPNY